jgi:hypothetical protein
MWDLLFVLSFLINVGLLVYFLKPQLPKPFDKKPKEEPVVGYQDDMDLSGPVSLKQADTYHYADVFANKGWRNMV